MQDLSSQERGSHFLCAFKRRNGKKQDKQEKNEGNHLPLAKGLMAKSLANNCPTEA